jgi:hypothetical protein
MRYLVPIGDSPDGGAGSGLVEINQKTCIGFVGETLKPHLTPP